MRFNVCKPNYLLAVHFETSHLPPLFDPLPLSDPGHKKFLKRETGASLVCGKPWKDVYAICQQSLRNPLALYNDYDILTMIFELSSNSINL